MNNKKQLTRKLICEEIYNQILLGNTIGGNDRAGKEVLVIKVKKKPITQNDLIDIETKILKKNIAGYHYEISLINSNRVIFTAPQEQVEKLKKVLINKDFAICP